jgi:hypothetical protein
MLGPTSFLGRRAVLGALVVAGIFPGDRAAAQAPLTDPLPSWNDGDARKAITDFVDRVTREGGAEY